MSIHSFTLYHPIADVLHYKAYDLVFTHAVSAFKKLITRTEHTQHTLEHNMAISIGKQNIPMDILLPLFRLYARTNIKIAYTPIYPNKIFNNLTNFLNIRIDYN